MQDEDEAPEYDFTDVTFALNYKFLLIIGDDGGHGDGDVPLGALPILCLSVIFQGFVVIGVTRPSRHRIKLVFRAALSKSFFQDKTGTHPVSRSMIS